MPARSGPRSRLGSQDFYHWLSRREAQRREDAVASRARDSAIGWQLAPTKSVSVGGAGSRKIPDITRAPVCAGARPPSPGGWSLDHPHVSRPGSVGPEWPAPA